MKTNYILLLLTALSLASCRKYLDQKSDAALVVPRSIDDVQALMDDADRMNYLTTPNYMMASEDEFFATATIIAGISDQDVSAYKWQAFNYTYPNDWSTGYVPVYNANLAIETLDRVEKTTANAESWNNAKGSAFFYRAFYFLELAWTYAKAYNPATATSDLGIPLRLSSDFNVASKRSSVAETYQQVITDAKAGIDLLPNLPVSLLRPSKAAAYALLARTYWSMRQYDDALKYADLALAINSNFIDYKKDITAAATQPFTRFNKETLFYSEASSFLSTNNISLSTIDTVVVASYQNNDIRKTAFFRTSRFYTGGKLFKGSYTGQAKYFTGLATDEMLLIKAECHARLKDKDAALAALNKLAALRYDATFAPFTATDASDALAKILVERRKELLMRGLRWIDIKRRNLDGENITLKRVVGGQTFTLAPNSPFYALPLPTDIIQQTGIPQN